MTPADLRATLVDLNTVMQSDLLALWRALDGQDVEFLREALQAELPAVVDPYLSAAGDVTADWYESQAPELAFTAAPAPLPPESQLQATARWAAGTVLTKTAVTPLDLLSGSMQRALFDESRRTVLDNVESEPGAKWARYASANACPFCRMVATRGDVYTSESAAGGYGSKYHDHCRCLAVAVRPGKTYDPPSYVEDWQAEYTRARQAADGNDAKSILSAWRKLQPE